MKNTTIFTLTLWLTGCGVGNSQLAQDTHLVDRAQCGMSGLVEDRIADCNESIGTLRLAMHKAGFGDIWYEPITQSVYFVDVDEARTWAASKSFCQSLKGHFPGDFDKVWGLASVHDFPSEALAVVYPKINNADGELRYWMTENFLGSGFEKHAYYYSTKTKGFASVGTNASRDIYRAACRMFK
jgi:hypothetical protein